jgi:hypothetical protein
MRLLSIAAAASFVVVVTSAPTGAGQPLSVAVSPKIAPAPGYVRVSARIEPSDDNRALEITAVSEDFSRSSVIQLDGSRAPRVQVVDYANLPAGTYQVGATLIGQNGRRAEASRFVQVVPMAGQR